MKIDNAFLKLFSKNPAEIKTPSFAGVLEVAHDIPGRIRLKIPSTKGDVALANRVASLLAGMKGVSSALPNPKLGTLLIKYDPAELQPLLIVAAASKCFDFEGEIKHKHSLLANEFKHIRFAINHSIMNATRGILDVRSSMTIILIVYMIKIALSTSSIPINVLWWLYQCIEYKR